MEHLQYPVGRHIYDPLTIKHRKDECINTLARLCDNCSILATQIEGANKLEQPYRPDGWTARQVIHHVADSHMHALLRFKLTLTEDQPTIKPYDEGSTATLADYKSPIDGPMMILNAVHFKWVTLLQNMSDADFDSVYIHPQYGKRFSLWEALSLYEWHSRHHLGHLELIAKSI
jgi:hypothetical protein